MSVSLSIKTAIIVTSLAFSSAGYGREITNTWLEQKVERALNQELTQFIKPFAGASFDVKVRPLPNKKTLACDQSVEMTQSASSKAPVGVVKRVASCAGHWRLVLTADVEVLVPAVHSAMPLARGDYLSGSQLTLKNVSYKKLRGQYYASFQPLEGRQLKRTVAANKLVTSNMLEPDFLVRKGDSVMIQAGSKALQVSMPGLALENGSLKESIRVRNRSSGKVVDARVISEGKVSILF